MMGYYHNTLGGALSYTLLDKLQALLVLSIEISRRKATPIIQNLPKVIHSTMYKILILWTNVRPKG